MSRLRFSAGPVTVTMDDGFTRAADRILRSAAGTVVAGIEREIEGVYSAARAAWPVRTGRSRDGLDWHLRWDQSSGKVEGVITNDVEYVRYIRAPVKQGFGSVLQELVKAPVRAAADRLVATLGPDIVAAVRAAGG